MINKTTLETILNFTHAASKDATRYQLTHVHLKRLPEDPLKVRIEATNGHFLVYRDTEDPSLLEALEGLIDACIDEDKTKVLMAHLKSAGRYMDFVNINLKDFLLTDINYPNTSALIPKINTDNIPTRTLGFNPEYITLINKCFGKPKTLKVTIPNDPHSAMVIDSGDYHAVLMPVRV